MSGSKSGTIRAGTGRAANAGEIARLSPSSPMAAFVCQERGVHTVVDPFEGKQ